MSGPVTIQTQEGAPPPQNPATGGTGRQPQETTAIIFGAIVLAFTFLYLVTDIARMAETGTTLYGPGLWFGLMFIAGGVLGVLSGVYRRIGLHIAALVISIFSIMMVITASIVLPVDVASQDFIYIGSTYNAVYDSGSLDMSRTEKVMSRNNYKVALLVLGAIGFLAILGSSIVSCINLCKCCTERTVYVHNESVVAVGTGNKPNQTIRYVAEPQGPNTYMHLMNQPNEGYEMPVFGPRQPDPSAPSRAAQPLPQPPPYEDPPVYDYIEEERWAPVNLLPPGSRPQQPPPVLPPPVHPHPPVAPPVTPSSPPSQPLSSIDAGYMTPVASGDYSDIQIDH